MMRAPQKPPEMCVLLSESAHEAKLSGVLRGLTELVGLNTVTVAELLGNFAH